MSVFLESEWTALIVGFLDTSLNDAESEKCGYRVGWI
jgi:hypothetical protein